MSESNTTDATRLLRRFATGKTSRLTACFTTILAGISVLLVGCIKSLDQDTGARMMSLDQDTSSLSDKGDNFSSENHSFAGILDFINRSDYPLESTLLLLQQFPNVLNQTSNHESTQF